MMASRTAMASEAAPETLQSEKDELLAQLGLLSEQPSAEPTLSSEMLGMHGQTRVSSSSTGMEGHMKSRGIMPPPGIYSRAELQAHCLDYAPVDPGFYGLLSQSAGMQGGLHLVPQFDLGGLYGSFATQGLGISEKQLQVYQSGEDAKTSSEKKKGRRKCRGSRVKAHAESQGDVITQLGLLPDSSPTEPSVTTSGGNESTQGTRATSFSKRKKKGQINVATETAKSKGNVLMQLGLLAETPSVEPEVASPTSSPKKKKGRANFPGIDASEDHTPKAIQQGDVLTQLGLLPTSPSEPVFGRGDTAMLAVTSQASESSQAKKRGRGASKGSKPTPGVHESTEVQACSHDFCGFFPYGFGYSDSHQCGFVAEEALRVSTGGGFIAEGALKDMQQSATAAGTPPEGTPRKLSEQLDDKTLLQNLLLAFVLHKAQERSKREDQEEDADLAEAPQRDRESAHTDRRERTWSRTPSPESQKQSSGPNDDCQFSDFFLTHWQIIYNAASVVAAETETVGPDLGSPESDSQFSSSFMIQCQAMLNGAKLMPALPEQQETSNEQLQEPQFSQLFMSQIEAVRHAASSVAGSSPRSGRSSRRSSRGPRRVSDPQLSSAEFSDFFLDQVRVIYHACQAPQDAPRRRTPSPERKRSDKHEVKPSYASVCKVGSN